jgi:hypothetical protein
MGRRPVYQNLVLGGLSLGVDSLGGGVVVIRNAVILMTLNRWRSKP